MTTLFNYLQDANAIPVPQKQTVIWNSVKYENPLFEGFGAEFSFDRERSELTIEIASLFQGDAAEQNERYLGKFVINLEQLSALYGVPQDTLFSLFDDKITPMLYIKGYDYQWRDDLVNFLMEKFPYWGDEWSFNGTTFRFNSPFIKTNIDTIIQELMSSLIEFGCK